MAFKFQVDHVAIAKALKAKEYDLLEKLPRLVRALINTNDAQLDIHKIYSFYKSDPKITEMYLHWYIQSHETQFLYVPKQGIGNEFRLG